MDKQTKFYNGLGQLQFTLNKKINNFASLVMQEMNETLAKAAQTIIFNTEYLEDFVKEELHEMQRLVGTDFEKEECLTSNSFVEVVDDWPLNRLDIKEDTERRDRYLKRSNGIDPSVRYISKDVGTDKDAPKCNKPLGLEEKLNAARCLPGMKDVSRAVQNIKEEETERFDAVMSTANMLGDSIEMKTVSSKTIPLKSDLKTDSTKKDYSCDQCQFTSSTNKDLLKRIKGVHYKIKDFLCTLCEYKTSTRELQ